jgi:hypothetical protein
MPAAGVGVTLFVLGVLGVLGVLDGVGEGVPQAVSTDSSALNTSCGINFMELKAPLAV